MAPFYPARSASLAIASFGTIANIAFATQVLAAWSTFKWEPESEWEASVGKWRIDGLKIIWVLLSTYFVSAAMVCSTGFIGIIKNKPPFVRVYRDYSIVDFSFCTFFTFVATYAAFRSSARAGVCEELSHHPELMRDVLEMGLNLENCERWLEGAVFAFVACMIIFTAVRLHFLFAVSNYYSSLVRHHHATSFLPRYRDVPLTRPRSQANEVEGVERVLLLPRSLPHTTSGSDEGGPVVYAPIPLSSLPAELAQDLCTNATEAWVSHVEPAVSCDNRPHRGHNRHHRSHRSSRTPTRKAGGISLPIGPEEGLLPVYDDDTLKA